MGKGSVGNKPKATVNTARLWVGMNRASGKASRSSFQRELRALLNVGVGARRRRRGGCLGCRCRDAGGDVHLEFLAGDPVIVGGKPPATLSQASGLTEKRVYLTDLGLGDARDAASADGCSAEGRGGRESELRGQNPRSSDLSALAEGEPRSR